MNTISTLGGGIFFVTYDSSMRSDAFGFIFHVLLDRPESKTFNFESDEMECW
jgi:hypothetical protein